MTGYTAFENDCGPYYPKVKQSLKFLNPRRGKQHPISHRPPVSVSLGCHVPMACPPKPSHDPISAGSGAIKRIGTQPGGIPRKLKRRFIRFCRLFNKRWIPRICRTTDISVKAWLESAPYSESRKQELWSNWIENQGLLHSNLKVKESSKKRVYAVKNFIKDEFYQAFKHPRMINSRTDLFKCMVGPIFAQISKCAFGLKYPGRKYGPLIKYVPVSERPVVLHDLLFKASGDYQITDYSSFEALFTAEMMSACEFQLYSHCTANLDVHDDFMGLCEEAFTRTNTLHNKWFTILIEATRMSGEMNTSLGNGYANMMLTLFMANQRTKGTHTMEQWIDKYYTYVKGVFEGDDGLCTFKPGSQPETEDFTNFGAIIKLENVTEIGKASFCGNLFDEEDLVIVTDPLYVIATLGWTNRKYVHSNRKTKDALLRCKAQSFLHQYPGCPLIQAMACWILRVTPSDKSRELKMINQMDQWNRVQAMEAQKIELITRKVPPRTRMLVSKLYDIPPEDQVTIETWFNEQTKLCEIDIPCLNLYWPKSWCVFAERHIMNYYDTEPVISMNEKGNALAYVDRMKERVLSIEELKRLI